jgi:hypothetical protein
VRTIDAFASNRLINQTSFTESDVSPSSDSRSKHNFLPQNNPTTMAILLPLFLALLCCITHSNALSTISRRSFVASSPFLIASTARAADSSYTKSTDAFSYTFTPPADCEIGNKPLKTHLEEVNFSSSTTKGYQFGVTVDPVRINSLREVSNS